MPRFAFLVAVFTLYASSEPVAAQRIESNPLTKPGHPDDLLIGPAKVTAVFQTDDGTKTKTVTLLFLTKTHFVYRERDDGRAIVFPGRLIKSVTTLDKQSRWTWDAKAMAFQGEPAMPKPIDIVAGKTRPEQVAGYLVTRAEFLHLELNNALTARNESRVEKILNYAEELGKYARSQSLTTIAELFDLESYGKDQQALQKQLAQEEESLRQKEVDTARQLAAARARYNARAQLSMLQMLAGGGVAYLGENRELRGLGADVAVSGLRDLSQSAAQHELEKKRQEELLALYQEDAVKQFADLNGRFRKAAAALSEKVGAAWKTLGVDPERLKQLDAIAETLLTKKDLAAALELLDRRLDYMSAKGISSPSFLMAVNDLKLEDLSRKSRDGKDRTQRADGIFQLALNTVGLTKLIPPNRVFDTDRALVLAAAGKLVHQAVVYAQGPTNWAGCYDPRADYGVRILDIALSYGLRIDTDGSIRSIRAALLFQRGLFPEALDQGIQVQQLREKDPVSMINLARFHVKGGDAKEAVVCFEKAIKAGFRDLRVADSDGDLAAMRNIKADLWKQRDEPDKLDVFVAVNPATSGQKFPSYTVEIKNKTRYPLTNMKVRLVGYLPAKFRQKPETETSKEIRIDYLGPAGSPNDSYLWVDAYSTNNAYTKSELKVVLDDVRNPRTGRTPLSGTVPIKSAKINLLRPFGW